MDTMHLKLNSAQLKKISPEPHNAHGDLIEISKVVRYLGGFLVQPLNFTQHIKVRVKKSNYQYNKNSRNMYLTVQTCTTLILMSCITQLDYANAILYGLPKSTLEKYQTIQNMCTKLVLNKNKYSSSSLA